MTWTIWRDESGDWLAEHPNFGTTAFASHHHLDVVTKTLDDAAGPFCVARFDWEIDGALTAISYAIDEPGGLFVECDHIMLLPSGSHRRVWIKVGKR